MNIPGTRPKPPTRILYADDDPALRRGVQRALAEAGYDVAISEHGAAAWQRLCREEFDLLITDNQMPELTGMELIHKLRATGHDLPVILVSAVLGPYAMASLSGLRCEAALGKPFSSQQLIALVREVLQSPGVNAPVAIDWSGAAFESNRLAPSHWGINE